MISIKSSSNRLSSVNIRSSSNVNRLSLIVNRSQRFHFVVIIMRVFIIFVKFVILIVRPIIAFYSSMFSNFFKMRAVREHFEYKII